MGRQWLSIALLLASVSGIARAETVADRLEAVRAAVAEGDKKQAKKLLMGADVLVADSNEILSASQIALLFYLRGVEASLRRRQDAAMDAWRQTLLIDNLYEWDSALVADRDQHRLFEALRKEVGSRDEVSPGAPEKSGLAKLYVDGERIGSETRLLAGVHLAQVSCPETGVHGVWTDFEEPVAWLAMCPEGIDTTVVAADAPADDEFGGMGPVFGVAEEDPDPVPVEVTPEPEEAVATKPSKPAREKQGLKWNEVPPGLYMMAGGGVLFVTGTVVNFAMVNPSYRRIESARTSAGGISQAQAAQVSRQFNVQRGVTLGLMGGGLVLAGTGVFFMEAPIVPILSPFGMGLSGSW